MWFEDAVWYQIYPLGMCGAPEYNSWDLSTWNGAPAPVNRIQQVIRWIPHITQLGITAVYFSPIFQSDKHGYDTRDYYTVDARLGSDDDFAAVCSALHDAGLRVILDGVFNHVGRGFWAFRDVQKNKQNSQYKDWFFIDWSRNSNNNDGFYYEGWEGCYDLVKLNLSNPAVVEHLLGAVKKWIELFKIDGIRLDVAYSLDRTFMKKLREFCNGFNAGLGGAIALTGETIYAKDYDMVSAGLVDSCTNYEVYKGLYSSFNDHNLFELSWSLNRLFGPNGICKNTHLLTFLDNHDVSRIASIIHDKKTLPILFALLFAVPGVPCVYYGSEWEQYGNKCDGDAVLRPYIAQPKCTALSDFIRLVSSVYAETPALRYGTFTNVYTNSEQYVFCREHHDPFTGTFSRVVVMLNISAGAAFIPPANISGICNASCYDLLTHCNINLSGGVKLEPYGRLMLIS